MEYDDVSSHKHFGHRIVMPFVMLDNMKMPKDMEWKKNKDSLFNIFINNVLVDG